MDFQIELQAIRQHLDVIEAGLKAARKEQITGAYTGSSGNYRNVDTNGNYSEDLTVEEWNAKIREDR